MRRIVTVLIVVAGFCGCTTKGNIPAYLKEYSKEYKADPGKANLRWFTDAGYGLFIHYGLCSNLAWGEWEQLNDTIPVAEYAKLKDQFTPNNFDADFITDLVLDAGMKYITNTSKHRDGFRKPGPGEQTSCLKPVLWVMV